MNKVLFNISVNFHVTYSHILSLIIAFFAYPDGFSQQQLLPEGKLLLFENKAVKITAERNDCHDVKNGIHIAYYLLSINNLTQKDIRVTFNKTPWYNGICTNCHPSSKELEMEFSLKPHETISGTCDTKNLRVYIKHLDIPSKNVLTDLKVSSVNVTDDEE